MIKPLLNGLDRRVDLRTIYKPANTTESTIQRWKLFYLNRRRDRGDAGACRADDTVVG
jgi:hypothetical protein